MRALLKTGAEQAEIASVPKPQPKPGEALVRIHAVALCASDLPGWASPDVGDRNRGGWNPSQPGLTGHELSGVIEDVGDGVDRGRIGEEVWIDPICGCGECSACEQQRYNLCRRAYVVCNGYADYVTAPANMVLPIPPDTSMNVASMIADMLGTPMGATKRANIEAGETVAVWGLGPVGLGLVQGARIAGAERIVGVDLHENRRALATELGATDVVNPAETDPVAFAKELSNGDGVDVVLHSVAAAEPTRQAFDALRLEGRMVTVAGFPPAGGQNPKTVIGNWACYHADFPEYLAAYSSGAFQLAPYVTQTFPFESFAEAFRVRLHEPGASIKVVLELV